MSKKLTYQQYAHSLSDEQLVNYHAQVEEAIEVSDCFGVRDMVMREALEAEADKRGLVLEYLGEEEYV